MKVEIKLFGILVPFFAVLAVVYGYFTDMTELVGVVALGLTAALCVFIAGYLWIIASKLDARPDDDPEGEIADQAGEYGFFSPGSWWPLALGAASALVFLGAAVGWWLMMIGIPFAALALVGWVFEYFRGEKAI